MSFYREQSVSHLRQIQDIHQNTLGNRKDRSMASDSRLSLSNFFTFAQQSCGLSSQAFAYRSQCSKTVISFIHLDLFMSCCGICSKQLKFSVSRTVVTIEAISPALQLAHVCGSQATSVTKCTYYKMVLFFLSLRGICCCC